MVDIAALRKFKIVAVPVGSFYFQAAPQIYPSEGWYVTNRCTSCILARLFKLEKTEIASSGVQRTYQETNLHLFAENGE